MVYKMNKMTAHVGGWALHGKDDFKIENGARASVELMSLSKEKCFEAPMPPVCQQPYF
jgi:hypothetical protein